MSNEKALNSDAVAKPSRVYGCITVQGLHDVVWFGDAIITPYNGQMEPLTKIFFVVALSCVGWLSYQLDQSNAEVATLQAEKEQAHATLRTIEHQNALRLKDIEHDTQTQIDAAMARATDSKRAADGLRKQLATFAKRGDATDTTAATECTTDQSRVDLLAVLLAELDGMAGEYAAAADESRQRGLACELSYEAVR